MAPNILIAEIAIASDLLTATMLPHIDIEAATVVDVVVYIMLPTTYKNISRLTYGIQVFEAAARAHTAVARTFHLLVGRQAARSGGRMCRSSSQGSPGQV